MYKYSKNSLKKLQAVDYRLVLLFTKIIDYYDHTILTGHRTHQEQTKAFLQKRSKVSWPNSKHNSVPSRAIDVAPWPIPDNWGADNWKDLVHFYEFAAIVRYEANKMGIAIRWGGDWDGDNDYKDQKFNDLVHFELKEN